MKRFPILTLVTGLLTVSGLAGAAVFSTSTVDQPHAYVSVFGSTGTGAGQFSEPTDVKYNPVNGEWVVVDHNNHRVQVFSTPGVFAYQLGTTGVPGSAAGEFNFPRAVAFNPLNGDMYITDTDNNRVQVFDELGVYKFEFGTPGGGASSANGEFDFPTGIVFNAPFGNVVQVVDSGNNRVQNFTAAGVYAGQFGSPGGAPSFADGEFNFPVGICLDGSGNIYVTERSNHRVQHLEPTGFYLNQFGGLAPGSGPGQFNNPIAVQHTSAGGGRLYVADWVNNRIQIFDNGGAYLGQFRGFGPGQLSGMQGMYIQGDDLWVANGFADNVKQFRFVPGIGEHNSLVEKDDFLYLSTYDAINQDLIYGLKVNWGWEFFVLDSAGDVGQYSSLVLDSVGRPHISYHEAPGTLKYAHSSNIGATWTIETVRGGPGTFGRGSSIAVNTADEPRIVYGDELAETLEFSERLGGFWVENPAPSPGGAFSVSLAMDAQDRPHIAFWDPQQTFTDLIQYAVLDGPVWNTELIDSTSISSAIGHVSLALDKAGSPRVAYQLQNELRYAERLGENTWQIDTVDNSGTVNTGQYASLALDPSDGSPRIAYLMDDSDFYYVNFAARELENWATQTVEGKNPGSGAEYVSMTLDAIGNPLMMYSGSLSEAAGVLLNATFASPNTVRGDGPKNVSVYGPNVGIGPPISAQLIQADGPSVITSTGSSTTGPDLLTLDFFMGGQADGPYHLALTNSAGSDTLLNAVVVHSETVDVSRVTTQVGIDRFGRYTKSGSPERIAFMSDRHGSQSLYYINPLFPDNDANLTTIPTVGAPSSLDWSGDGTQVVFRNDLDEQLYTVTLSTGIVAPELTGGSVITTSWSPVDNRILYNAGNISSTIDLYTIQQGTDIITPLTFAAGQEVFFSAEFSPDGQAVAAIFADSTFAPTRSLVKVQANGLEVVTTLADPGFIMGSPAWSPDGQWIAYIVDSGGNADIWLINSNGLGNPIQITSDPGQDFEPFWSPDGLTLYWISDRVNTSFNLGSDIFSTDMGVFLVDGDGDLVPDIVDACPQPLDIGEVDRDLDGCPDGAAGFRHSRFWSPDQLPVFFQTDALGDSSIGDGSDFTELNAAFNDWSTGPLAGTSFTGGDDFTRAGSSDASVADGINSVSFLDEDGYDFGTIAITLSSVVLTDTTINGRWYHPGEILDADVLFNTFYYDFETPSAPGPVGAYDLGTVAIHEFGHFAGFAHSSIRAATMFYVVFQGTGQRILKDDDVTLGLRRYSDPPILPVPPSVEGKVLRGQDSVTPVVGAAVYAFDGSTGDTVQVTYTGMDGTYRFYPPLPPSIRIFTHPLDGSVGVNGLRPGNVGQVLATVADDDFLPEFYDQGSETNNDNGTGTLVNPGFVVGANIITNLDLNPPSVVSTSPVSLETVPATTAITVLFDDRIDLTSISNATFGLDELSGPGVAGSAALLKFDSLLVFQPDTLLKFNTDYVLTIGPGITDRFGNAMTTPTIVNFSVGAQPPATVVTVSPGEVPVGGALVIQGTGFSPTASSNEVFFDGGVSAFPFSATLEQLVVTVPTGAQSGSLFVNVDSGVQVSNTFPIIIVPQRGVPVGTSLGSASLGGDPRRVDVAPNGVYAYVAHDNGVTAVKADPAFGDFLTDTSDITLSGGSRGVVVLPSGLRALAISSTPPRLTAIDADTGSAFINTVVPGSEVSLAGEPLGITVIPGGAHVLIVYSDRVAKHIAGAGGSFGLEIKEWNLGGGAFAGDISVSVDGGEAFATTTAGEVAVLGMAGGEGVVALLPGGPNLREVAGRPDALRFLGVDEVGTVREYGKRGPLLTQTVQSGGYTGLVLSPEGGYAFAANFILNKVDVMSLTGSSPALVSSIPTGVDPTDVATGNGGRYLYVATASSDLLEVYDTAVGPVITGMSPQTVTPGGLVTLTGFRFAPGNTTVNYPGGSVPADTVRSDSTALVFQVPLDAPLGTHPLSVTVGGQTSNTLNYKSVLRTDEGLLSFSNSIFTGAGPFIINVMESPAGDYLVTTYSDASMIVVQADPSQPDFLRDVQAITPTETGFTIPSGASTHALAFAPDGSKLYGVNGGVVNTFDITPGSSIPFALGGIVIDDVGTAALGADILTVTPDGRRLLAVDGEGDQLHIVNTANDSLETSVFVGASVPPTLVVHPDGSAAFVGTFIGVDPGVRVVDLNEDSPSYGQVVDRFTVTLGGPSGSTPLRMIPTPDGTQLLILTVRPVAVSAEYEITVINIDPNSPGYLTHGTPFSVGADTDPILSLNHSGTVLFAVDVTNANLGAWELATTSSLGTTGFLVQFAGSRMSSMSADDGRVYVGGLSNNFVVIDVSGASGLSFVSGTGQVGVVNEPFPSPIVVQAAGTNPQGTMIRFQVSGGSFGFPDQNLYTAADENGQVSAIYTPAFPGLDPLAVLSASGNLFADLTAVADTTLAPPQIISVLPGPTYSPGVNTTVVADFSKAIASASVNNTTFIVRQGSLGPPLAGAYSFTNGNARVVFTPALPLDYSTAYEIELTAGIQDNDANALLGTPAVSGFTTGAIPPLVLNSIQTSSAVPGNSVVLAGTNFQSTATANLVLFGNGVSAVPAQASTQSLTVAVPFGATSGNVRVIINPGTTPDTSNARFLTVLPSSTTPVSEVVNILDVPTSGQQIAVLPDGSRSYMTSSGANTLVPVSLAAATAEAAISTGQHPYGVAANAASDRVYVTNFFSNSVSVIATDPDSANFHSTVATIATGSNPTGVAVHPNGFTVYVVNYGDSTLTFIDTDPNSAGYNSAKSTTTTSKKSKTVALSPDAATLVLGTSDGLLILNAVDGSAKSTATTGKSSRSIALTPDGAYAVVLTDDNFLLLIDIRDGVADEDRAKSSSSTGGGGKAIALSPDGAFVYVTTVNDQVLVFQIVTQGGGAAVAEAVGVFAFQLVATIDVGENPNGMAIDFTTNTLLVVNEGDNTITFINISDITMGPVKTLLSLDPGTLNLNSKGKFVNAALQFPTYLNPADLVLTSVLMNGTLGPDTTRVVVLKDANEDLIDEAHIKFKRSEVFGILPEGQNVPVVITGLVGDRAFTSLDTIRVFRPKLKSPAPGSAYPTNAALNIQWDSAQDGPADRMDIFWSADLGASWDTVTTGTEDDSSYVWTTPEVNSSECMIMLVAYDSKDVITGIALMDEGFTISEAVGLEHVLPLRFALLPASPNPFGASTNIRFDLPVATPVSLQIFGLDGSLVRSLAKDELYPAGRHAVLWDGRNVRGQRTSGGVYFLRIQAGKEQAVRKIVRLRH